MFVILMGEPVPIEVSANQMMLQRKTNSPQR